MPETDQFDDFSHLPTVDAGPDDAARAKAALWKQHRQVRQTRVDKTTIQPAPADYAQVPSSPSAPVSHDAEWGDLLSQDSADVPLPAQPLQIPPRAQMVSTPVEEETRGDVPSRARTIIRRAAPPAPVVEDTPAPAWPETDPGSVTRVILASPRRATAPLVAPVQEEQPVFKDETEVLTAAPLPEPVPVPQVEEMPSDEPENAPAVSDEKIEPPTDSPTDLTKSADPADPTKPPATETPATKHWIQENWERWGGRSLALSIGIHAALLLIGAFIVMQQVVDPQVDFLPGGGSVQGKEAAQDLQHKIQQKKNPWLKTMPLRKIAAASISEVVLPEEVPDLLDLPQATDLLSGGKLSGGMGLGGGGGGFGKGMGLGARSGMVFQPLSMFGREIKAKRLALILDVSASMAPHLPRVIAEVDKVARDSIVILFYGCGLESPPPKGLDGEEVFRTSGIDFEKYWRLSGGTLDEARKFKFSPSDVIPMEDIFRLLSKRPQTYFVHNVGTGYTWTALLCEQVRSADALYWFADFQDRTDFKQINIVRENLQRRKQRLYIHAYQRGSAFDTINTQLVQTTGGDVIEE